MVWGREKNAKTTPEEREMQTRTVLLLFMENVAGVDRTKFNMTADLEKKLGYYPKACSTGAAPVAVTEEEGKHFEFAWVRALCVCVCVCARARVWLCV